MAYQSFSVVVPLYNKENHIQRAIRSVLNQTHQKFELIIVDDGSTDASFTRASEVQDARIRIIRQENQGVSAARNRAIREAKNDWMAFLDADDEWLPGFLEEITVLRDQFPECTVAGTGYFLRFPNGVLQANSVNLSIPLGWRGILERFAGSRLAHSPFYSSTFSASRQALLDVGLYPEGVSNSEDTALYLKLSVSQTIAFSNTPLAIYHLEAENRSWKGFSLTEKYATKIGKELLNDPNVPESLKEGIYESVVRSEIVRARALLYQRKKEEALEVLSFCSKSKIYSETVRKLTKWANLPRYCYRFMYSVKDRVKRLLKILEDADRVAEDSPNDQV